MPLYEYECIACRKHTEKIQKFSDPEITVCPHCGGSLERVISAPAIAFKGGGWYADGYGNAKAKSSGESSTGPSSESGNSEAGGKPPAASDAPSSSVAPAAPPATTAPASASTPKT